MALEKTITIKGDTDDAVKGINAVVDSLDGVTDSAEDSQKAIKDVGESSKKAAKGTKTLATGFKAVGTAFKAIGIGLILGLFAKLVEVLTKNQKVMDVFNSVMVSLEVAFKDLFSFVTDNFMPAMNAVKDFFANLTFDKIKKAIQENLIERFNSLLEVIGFLGTAFKKLFEGDFKGALDAVKEAGKEMIDVYTGVDDTFGKVTETITNAVKSISNYAKETFKAAEAMTALGNQALIAAAINQGIIEQYDRQAEQLRQIRDDDSKNIEVRIEANKKLGEVLEEQQEIMLRNADLVIAAAQNEFNLNGNIENQIALIEARNEKLAIQAQIEGFRSEQLINVNSLLREKNEIEKAALDLLTETARAEAEAAAKKKAADEKAAAEEIALAKMVQDAKINMTIGTLDRISQLTEQNSVLSKATAAAAALINTYQGITAELATKTVTPFEFGLKIANIATTAAIGFKAVKNILSTNVNSGGGAASPSIGGGGAAAPSFNLVAGTGANQIAEGLSNQNQPIKAFVVASDVTSGQSLDRNIISNSSL